MPQLDYRFFLVLDGLFLLDWHNDAVLIYVAKVPEHTTTIATTSNLSVSGRKPIPPARDYQIEGIASNGTLPNDFDVKHLVFDGQVLSVQDQDETNPLAKIVAPRPDAIFGAIRYQIDAGKLLGDEPDSVLRHRSSSIVFCEKSILAYQNADAVRLSSQHAGQTFSAVSISGDRSLLAMYSRPTRHDMQMFHGAPLNRLLRFARGGNPNLHLTDLSRHDVQRLPADPEVEMLDLPVDPQTLLFTITGTGCGDVHVR